MVVVMVQGGSDVCVCVCVCVCVRERDVMVGIVSTLEGRLLTSTE